jgi:hypothetical protein
MRHDKQDWGYVFLEIFFALACFLIWGIFRLFNVSIPYELAQDFVIIMLVVIFLSIGLIYIFKKKK